MKTGWAVVFVVVHASVAVGCIFFPYSIQAYARKFLGVERGWPKLIIPLIPQKWIASQAYIVSLRCIGVLAGCAALLVALFH